jgi:RNA polymerase sigma-70 factor (ECF subfamily)
LRSIPGLRSTARLPSDRDARVRAMVDENLNLVARVLRRAGVPSSEIDDEIQRTFMVAASRIDDVQVGAERSFLIQVARNLAWHARRTLARRREVLATDPVERIESVATPEFLADRKQMRQLFDQIVGALKESSRVVFTLIELEGLSMTEVAATLRVPRGTVASRLRRARAQFRQHVAALDVEGALPEDAAARTAEPARLRRERMGALQRALLAAARSGAASDSTYAKTLSALGLALPRNRP